MNLKFSPDLFLEAAELNTFTESLDTAGFRKNILQNTTSFGLIKSSEDPLFANGRVQKDTDTSLGQRTIKINELFGIDKFGQFIHSLPQNGLPVPNDGNWYWVKIAYAVSNLEQGTFSISANGDLIDTSGNAILTKKFRGMPNFPTRISFPNSVYNTLQYDCLEVIDDQHATLQHPATNTNGISTFTPETGLTMQIIGTFTKGVAVPTLNQKPFNYDSALVTLVQENFLNTRPLPYVQDAEFYIARVMATDTTVIVQDKRNEYWMTNIIAVDLEIDRNPNPLIGIESAQFNNSFSPCDRNIVKLSWGMRSNNWSIDSSNNIVTYNSGNGGKYKSVNDFNNGDLNGYRLYTPSGNYHKIISSVKQGSAINFTVDNLEVDNFSSDGGSTLIPGYLTVVPDCDTVEIQFIPNSSDNVPAIQERFTFPVNELVGRCDVLVYAATSVLYNVQYRYKTVTKFTQWAAIPSDTTHGYYTEASFDGNGNLLPDAQTVLYPYTTDPTAGFIQLTASPLAISQFRNTVFKGDKIGVTTISDFSDITLVDLVVGTADNYLSITGAITLPNNTVIGLHTSGSVKGNEFRVHINCTSFNLNSKSFSIVADQGLPSQTTLKNLTQGDIYQMMNQNGGIVFDMKFDGTEWLIYQNYDLGKPFEVIQLDGSVDTLFNNTTGLGQVKGLFGYCCCNAARTINGVDIPDLRRRFLFGQDASGFSVGATGGTGAITLAQNQLPATIEFTANWSAVANSTKDREALVDDRVQGSGTPPDGQDTATFQNPGGGQQIGILNPYYALIFAKRVY